MNSRKSSDDITNLRDISVIKLKYMWFHLIHGSTRLRPDISHTASTENVGTDKGGCPMVPMLPLHLSLIPRFYL